MSIVDEEIRRKARNVARREVGDLVSLIEDALPLSSGSYSQAMRHMLPCLHQELIEIRTEEKARELSRRLAESL